MTTPRKSGDKKNFFILLTHHAWLFSLVGPSVKSEPFIMHLEAKQSIAVNVISFLARVYAMCVRYLSCLFCWRRLFLMAQLVVRRGHDLLTSPCSQRSLRFHPLLCACSQMKDALLCRASINMENYANLRKWTFRFSPVIDLLGMQGKAMQCKDDEGFTLLAMVRIMMMMVWQRSKSSPPAAHL